MGDVPKPPRSKSTSEVSPECDGRPILLITHIASLPNSVTEAILLPTNPRIIEIVDLYVNNYVMPKQVKGDAVHLAYASFHRLDFLLTWNCHHLANANKKRHIQVIHSRLGLHTPEIVTPLQLFEKEIIR